MRQYHTISHLSTPTYSICRYRFGIWNSSLGVEFADNVQLNSVRSEPIIDSFFDFTFLPRKTPQTPSWYFSICKK